MIADKSGLARDLLAEQGGDVLLTKIRLAAGRSAVRNAAMVSQNVLDVVFFLERGEQLELMDLLRERLTGPDQVGAEPDGSVVGTLSEEHQRILDERLDEVERDPDGGIPWEQARAEILAGFGRE